jgi:lambda family phage minor tail protein L
VQPLTLASALQKHQIAGTAPWFVLLDIFPNKDDMSIVLRVARNTDDVIWGGHTYLAFNFDIQSIDESTSGELPQVTITVSNVNRAVQGQLEPYGGGVGATVVLTVVNAADMGGDPVQQFTWSILQASATDQLVTFTLGAPSPLLKQFPSGLYVKNHCFHIFNSPTLQAALNPDGMPCGYTGALITCDHTLNGTNGCRVHGNQGRFGGFPGLDGAGFRTASVV